MFTFIAEISIVECMKAWHCFGITAGLAAGGKLCRNAGIEENLVNQIRKEFDE